MVDLVLIKFVGGVSGISGLILFGLSSTYKISFGKLGICGLLLYLLISLVMSHLIRFFKRVEVPERFRGAVPSVIFVVICLICVLLDKLVPGKSDALSITSYALFSILSLCTSRRSELGFETGFFSFFLSLFVQQLGKTNWKLLPIALVFCLVVLVLRNRSELLPSPNGDDRLSEEEEGVPLNPTPEIDDSQNSIVVMVEVAGQGLSPMDNEPDNPNQAVSEGIILDGDNSHNNGEVDGTSSSLAAVFGEPFQNQLETLTDYTRFLLGSHSSSPLPLRSCGSNGDGPQEGVPLINVVHNNHEHSDLEILFF